MDKVVLLDRDGVINFDSPDYIKSPDEWIPIPGSLEAIAQLTKAGYRVAVATNQAGIGRGYYDHETLALIHKKMLTCVSEAGGKIEAIAYCPHHPDDKCQCRKPQPGLLLQLAEKLNIELSDVPYWGDKLSDIEVALNVACQPALINTSNIADDVRKQYGDAIPIFENLAEAVENYLE